MGRGGDAAAAPTKRYYNPSEVAAHAAPDDCWVSFLGGVYDLTELIKENEGPLVQPLIKAAGSDISHWFEAATGDIKSHVDPITNLKRPYVPMGRFVHVPPAEPVGDWDTSFGTPWWKDDEKYKVGLLSLKTRTVRLKNVLTNQEDQLEIPAEETIEEIRERYLELNWHAASYTWKVLRKDEGEEYSFATLDMTKTLAENGVPDEDEEFEELSIENDFYLPVIHLYFNDDLTVA
mmetsp:Transcript_21753/g.73922  ORF Transcript_21753/g.73922 Transcript_21753/m.73922 type:complete len:234 (+) Transcript_21753:162-863(+)